MQARLNLCVEAMQNVPVIAAVKDDEVLDRVLRFDCAAVAEKPKSVNN